MKPAARTATIQGTPGMEDTEIMAKMIEAFEADPNLETIEMEIPAPPMPIPVAPFTFLDINNQLFSGVVVGHTKDVITIRTADGTLAKLIKKQIAGFRRAV